MKGSGKFWFFDPQIPLETAAGPQAAIAFNRHPQATKAICLHAIPLNTGIEQMLS